MARDKAECESCQIRDQETGVSGKIRSEISVKGIALTWKDDDREGCRSGGRVWIEVVILVGFRFYSDL